MWTISGSKIFLYCIYSFHLLLYLFCLLPFPSHLFYYHFPTLSIFFSFNICFPLSILTCPFPLTSHLLFFSITPPPLTFSLSLCFASSSHHLTIVFFSLHPLSLFSHFCIPFRFLSHLDLIWLPLPLSLSVSSPLILSLSLSLCSFSYGSFLVYQNTCFWLNKLFIFSCVCYHKWKYKHTTW